MLCAHSQSIWPKNQRKSVADGSNSTNWIPSKIPGRLSGKQIPHESSSAHSRRNYVNASHYAQCRRWLCAKHFRFVRLRWMFHSKFCWRATLGECESECCARVHANKVRDEKWFEWIINAMCMRRMQCPYIRQRMRKNRNFSKQFKYRAVLFIYRLQITMYHTDTYTHTHELGRMRVWQEI